MDTSDVFSGRHKAHHLIHNRGRRGGRQPQRPAPTFGRDQTLGGETAAARDNQKRSLRGSKPKIRPGPKPRAIHRTPVANQAASRRAGLAHYPGRVANAGAKTKNRDTDDDKAAMLRIISTTAHRAKVSSSACPHARSGRVRLVPSFLTLCLAVGKKHRAAASARMFLT